MLHGRGQGFPGKGFDTTGHIKARQLNPIVFMHLWSTLLTRCEIQCAWTSSPHVCLPAHTDICLGWLHFMPAAFLGWSFFVSQKHLGRPDRDMTAWKCKTRFSETKKGSFKETKCDNHMLSLLILVLFICSMRERLRGEQSLSLSSLPNHQTKILYPSQSRDIKSDISIFGLAAQCTMKKTLWALLSSSQNTRT